MEYSIVTTTSSISELSKYWKSNTGFLLQWSVKLRQQFVNKSRWRDLMCLVRRQMSICQQQGVQKTVSLYVNVQNLSLGIKGRPTRFEYWTVISHSVLLRNRLIPRPVQQFPAVYKTRRRISVFISGHLSLSRARYF